MSLFAGIPNTVNHGKFKNHSWFIHEYGLACVKEQPFFS